MDRPRHYKYKDSRCRNPRPAAAPPMFSQPEIIGYMSVDGNRQYHSDLSELRFVNNVPEGPVALDLNRNIHKAVKRTTQDNVEKIDLMLRFILDKGQYLDLSEEWTFVTYRRTLLDVMCKSWAGLEPRRVAATLLDGCVYLCSLQTAEQEVAALTRSDRDRAMCAWGYQFEQIVTSEVPNKPTAPDQPVIENAEFSLYLRARFGSHHLVYGAQIDGVLSTEETTPPPESGDYWSTLQYLRQQSYIELKTNRLIANRQQEANYKRRKLLYCWGQCYVGGLRGLVIGLRDDDGVVTHIQRMDTARIADYCQDRWSPEGPLSFLDHFLNYVKNHFKSKLRQLAHHNTTQGLHDGTTFGPITAQRSCDVSSGQPITAQRSCDVSSGQPITAQRSYDVRNMGPITAQFDIMTDRDRTIVVSEGESVLPQWYVEGRRKYVKECVKIYN